MKGLGLADFGLEYLGFVQALGLRVVLGVEVEGLRGLWV